MKINFIAASVCLVSLGVCGGASAGELFGSASSAGMSAASAGSASLRGSSTAISGSSGSASDTDNVAAGRYRLTDIALAPGQGDKLALSLEPLTVNQTGVFQLTLPKTAIGNRRFARGDTIHVHRQAYGLAFTHQESDEPFFLVVKDAWELDLQTRVVTN